jgi:glycogen debranching enzyme
MAQSTDGDGFVEYGPQTGSGLVNQGWKDSYDSIFHTDGSLAGGPIALCEVQGYVFAAKTQAAKLARRMGEHDLEKKLRAEAQILREKFDAAFWCADLGTFALTLDGSKAPCRARADNAIIALGLARYGFASLRHVCSRRCSRWRRARNCVACRNCFAA